MLSPEQFCTRVGFQQSTPPGLARRGVARAAAGDEALQLSEVDLARARLIRDLRDGIGVNDEGIGVILNLIDQVHGLRSIVHGLLERLGSSDRPSGA